MGFYVRRAWTVLRRAEIRPSVESVGSVPTLRQDSCTVSGTEALWNAATTTSFEDGGTCAARITLGATNAAGFALSHARVNADIARLSDMTCLRVTRRRARATLGMFGSCFVTRPPIASRQRFALEAHRDRANRFADA